MHLRSRQSVSQSGPRSGGSVPLTVNSGGDFAAGGTTRAGLSQEEKKKAAYSKQGKKRRRKRRLNGSPKSASKAQIIFGGILTVFLLFLFFGVDFQDEAKKKSRREQKERLAAAAGGGISSTGANLKENNIDGVLSIGKGECLFDGHCPVHSSCAATARRGPSASGKGVCEPVESKGSPGSSADSKCLDACLQELERDEHWYQESKVHVEWSEDYESLGRPKGCLVVYTREKEQQQTSQRRRLLSFASSSKSDVYTEGIPPDLLDWVDKRFHHLKRVDPYDTANLDDDKWMAYCTAPCRSHSDCATPNSPTAFVCHDSTCVRRKPPNDRDSKTTTDDTIDKSMVIVTGATSSYFRGLTNLAASARYWAPHYRMVVYNLGMNDQELQTIRQWPNVLSVEWPDGIPASYPEHVHRGKKYAWKPLIVNETVHKYGGIFWMDAGSTFAGPIEPVVDVTRHTGIMLVKGQDLDMKQKSHKSTYQWFGYAKKTMQVGPHFSGNTQAFLYPSRYIDTIVIPNAKCALDINCISPEGSHLSNHRYDQTSISILAYAPKVQLPHYTEFLASDKKQLNPDLSKPSFKFVWTSRQSFLYYSEHDEEAKKAMMGNNNGDSTISQINMKLRGAKQHQIDADKENQRQQAKLQANDQHDHLVKQQQQHDSRKEEDSHRRAHGGIGLNFGGGRRKKGDDAPKFTHEQQMANEQAEIARQNNAGGAAYGAAASDDNEDIL